MMPAALWIGGGFVLLIAEMAFSGVFLGWVGLACLAPGIGLLFLPLSLAQMGLVFAVSLALSLACAMALRGIARARRTRTEASDSLIGRYGEVMMVEGRNLRVRVGGVEWWAAGQAKLGDTVQVQAISGETLLVRRAD